MRETEPNKNQNNKQLHTRDTKHKLQHTNNTQQTNRNPEPKQKK